MEWATEEVDTELKGEAASEVGQDPRIVVTHPEGMRRLLDHHLEFGGSPGLLQMEPDRDHLLLRREAASLHPSMTVGSGHLHLLNERGLLHQHGKDSRDAHIRPQETMGLRQDFPEKLITDQLLGIALALPLGALSTYLVS